MDKKHIEEINRQIKAVSIGEMEELSSEIMAPVVSALLRGRLSPWTILAAILAAFTDSILTLWHNRPEARIVSAPWVVAAISRMGAWSLHLRSY